MLKPGMRVAARFELDDHTISGGMATIYRARDAQLERDVAVKVLRPEYGADPDFLDRFRHEAQSAARVTGACFVMGEAAGVAAHLALQSGSTNEAVDIAALQSRLAENGAYLGRSW